MAEQAGEESGRGGRWQLRGHRHTRLADLVRVRVTGRVSGSSVGIGMPVWPSGQPEALPVIIVWTCFLSRLTICRCVDSPRPSQSIGCCVAATAAFAASAAATLSAAWMSSSSAAGSPVNGIALASRVWIGCG